MLLRIERHLEGLTKASSNLTSQRPEGNPTFWELPSRNSHDSWDYMSFLCVLLFPASIRQPPSVAFCEQWHRGCKVQWHKLAASILQRSSPAPACEPAVVEGVMVSFYGGKRFASSINITEFVPRLWPWTVKISGSRIGISIAIYGLIHAWHVGAKRGFFSIRSSPTCCNCIFKIFFPLNLFCSSCLNTRRCLYCIHSALIGP